MKTVFKMFVVFLAIFLSNDGFSQAIGSNVFSVKITTGKLELLDDPADLYAELSFMDDNANGILESMEEAKMIIKLTNKGTGKAQKMLVTIQDSHNDPHFAIQDGMEIPYIDPGATEIITISMRAGHDIKTQKHKLSINVKEHFGFNMEPAVLELQLLEYQKPKLELAGIQIWDTGADTYSKTEDGLLEAGEKIKVKMVVQNTGNNIAEDVNIKISTTNPNHIRLKKMKNTKLQYDSIFAGESIDLWYTIMLTNEVKTTGELPITLEASAKHIGNSLNTILPLKLNSTPPKPNIVEVKGDFEGLTAATFTSKSNKTTSKGQIVAAKGKMMNIKMVEPAFTKRPNSVAIVMGVENYKHLPKAPYAASDATLMEEYLRDRMGFEQVYLRTEDDISGFFFSDMFDEGTGEIGRAVTPGETELFVFYSGHGLPSKDGKDAYLFPQDGKVANVKRQGYSLSGLYDNLGKLNAKSITVVLDACFSGSSRSSEKFAAQNITGEKGFIDPDLAKPWLTDSTFTVFSSSSGSETSLGYDDAESGLFSYYLMGGMQGRADENGDKIITMGELKNYVIKNVSSMSVNIRGRQTPQFHGDENKIMIDLRSEEEIEVALELEKEEIEAALEFEKEEIEELEGQEDKQ